MKPHHTPFQKMVAEEGLEPRHADYDSNGSGW